MSNFINQAPFLRTSRSFPEDPAQLRAEINKAYLDTASIVNARTIGLFPTTRPALTGNSYFITSSQRQSSIRQIYTFDNNSLSPPPKIPLDFKLSQIDRFVAMYGQYNDVNNDWYGFIPGYQFGILQQNGFWISTENSTQPAFIVFVAGAGAPTPFKGTVVLEWLSLP